MRVFLCFLVLKTHVSATWKTLLRIAAPMPPIKTSLYPLPGSSGAWRQKWITSTPHWRPAISCGLGMFRPSFASARCTNFQPPRVQNNSLTATKHFLCLHLLHMTSSNSHLPIHNSNFSQNCWGKQHKCSKDNLGHSLHYQLTLKLKLPLVVKPHTWNLCWCGVVSNMTSNELVAKDNRNWSCSVEFFESLNLPTPKNATSRAENRWSNFSELAML